MKYYILSNAESHVVIDYSTEPISKSEGTIVHEADLVEWPSPEPKPWHYTIFTYDGANFDTEYFVNVDDVNARKLDLNEWLDDNDYKNLKNFETVWCLKAQQPGITDIEIIAQLPYDPIEVHRSHDKWRTELNELQKLVADT